MRLLIIEDHRDIAAGIADFLRALGHEVQLAGDGVSGLNLAMKGDCDVIVLDRMLPKLDGTELCRRLREHSSQVPILMLTALDTVADKVSGFEAGADDYLPKPFALAELRVRIEALHRRANGAREAQQLRVTDLCYDLGTLQATRAGKPVTLNPTTRKILELLMRASPQVVPRTQLEHELWGRNVPEDDVLRIHIHALRAAVDKPFRSKLLHTVHGAGYRLADDVA